MRARRSTGALAWASLLLATGGGVGAENWTAWPKCDEGPRLDPEERNSGGKLQAVRTHQIVAVEEFKRLDMMGPDQNPGLEQFWSAMQAEKEPLHVVVFFGDMDEESQLRVLASIVSCAFWSDSGMQVDGAIEPALFDFTPRRGLSVGPKWKGVWASEPFTHSNKRFLLMVLNEFGVARHRDGDQYRKLLRLLSEVSSVLVHVQGDAYWQHTWKDLIFALGKKPVRTSDAFSLSKPALIIAEHRLRQSLDGDSWALKPQEELLGVFVRSTMPRSPDLKSFADFLVQNFRTHNSTHMEDGREVRDQFPFVFTPWYDLLDWGSLPRDRDGILWNPEPFGSADLEDHCKYFRDMGEDSRRCLYRAGKSDFEPHPVPYYKLTIDSLMEWIHQVAFPRIFSWPGGERPLSGRMLFQYLKRGVSEINSNEEFTDTLQRVLFDDLKRELYDRADEILGPRRAEGRGRLPPRREAPVMVQTAEQGTSNGLSLMGILERLASADGMTHETFLVQAESEWNVSVDSWEREKAKLLQGAPDQFRNRGRESASKIEKECRREFLGQRADIAAGLALKEREQALAVAKAAEEQRDQARVSVEAAEKRAGEAIALARAAEEKAEKAKAQWEQQKQRQKHEDPQPLHEGPRPARTGPKADADGTSRAKGNFLSDSQSETRRSGTILQRPGSPPREDEEVIWTYDFVKELIAAYEFQRREAGLAASRLFQRRIKELNGLLGALDDQNREDGRRLVEAEAHRQAFERQALENAKAHEALQKDRDDWKEDSEETGRRFFALFEDHERLKKDLEVEKRKVGELQLVRDQYMLRCDRATPRDGSPQQVVEETWKDSLVRVSVVVSRLASDLKARSVDASEFNERKQAIVDTVHRELEVMEELQERLRTRDPGPEELRALWNAWWENLDELEKVAEKLVQHEEDRGHDDALLRPGQSEAHSGDVHDVPLLLEFVQRLFDRAVNEWDPSKMAFRTDHGGP